MSATLNRRRVNLIPEDLQHSFVNQRSILLLLVIALAGLPSLGLVASWVRWTYQSHVELATQRRNEVGKKMQTLLHLREENADRKVISAVEKALAEKLYWAEVFKELSNVAPKSIWLTSFEASADANGKKALIEGNGTSQTDIAEFLSRLEQSYFFRYVQIKFTEVLPETQPTQYRFQFEGRLFDKKGASNGAN